MLLKVPKKLKNSQAMSLSRNHDPVPQDNSQTLLWTVSCRSYFLPAEESTGTTFFLLLREFLHETAHNRIILHNWVMNSGKRHWSWIFLIYFIGAMSTTSQVPFSPILMERRQTSIQLISQKLCNSQQKTLDGWRTLQAGGKTCIFEHTYIVNHYRSYVYTSYIVLHFF